MSESSRRLPIYLVLDTSGSMACGPIEAVQAGLTALLSDLRACPQALETAALSVISFGNEAQQLVPLSDLAAFEPPHLNAGGSTNLAAALALTQSAITAEVRGATKTSKPDYRPLVFLMTDGCPDSGWESAAERFRSTCKATIICCAAGNGANVDVLRKISERVISLSSAEPTSFASFFQWISASVRATSQALTPAGGNPVGLPPLPVGMTIVP